MMNVSLEFEIIKSVFLRPHRAIELLDSNPSNIRPLIYLLLSSTFFSLNYLYGSYIGNPSAYWFIAIPFILPYNAAMMLLMFAVLTSAGIILGSGDYPAKRLYRNLMVIVLIPHNVLIFLGLLNGAICTITKAFYINVTAMEYGVILATGLTAVLSAYTLNRTRNVSEYASLMISTISAVVFIILSLLFFVSLFANRVYSV